MFLALVLNSTEYRKQVLSSTGVTFSSSLLRTASHFVNHSKIFDYGVLVLISLQRPLALDASVVLCEALQQAKQQQKASCREQQNHLYFHDIDINKTIIILIDLG